MREEKGAQSYTAQESAMDILQAAVVDPRLVYLFDNIPEMVFLKDADGYYNYMNAAALACLGLERDFIRGRRLTIYDMAPPDVARRLDEMDRRIMSSGTGLHNAEERVSGKDGQVRWYSGTRIPVRDGGGNVIGIAGISREITASKRQETLLRCHADLLEMIVKGVPLTNILNAVVETVEGMLDNVTGSVMLVDELGDCIRVGAAPGLPTAYSELIDGIKIGPETGSCGTAAWRREAVYVRDTFHDKLWSDYVEVAMRFGLRSCWSTPIMGNNDVLLGTFALYSGTVRMPSAMESEIIDMATNIAGIAIDRRRAEERVHFMAHHDPLTGLSNRNLFWSQFARAIHEARRESRLVAITYLDLDNFKQINDVYGHAVGDEVLRCFAERVGSCIRASDIAVRLGGDEFAIIFSNPTHDQAGILRRLEAIRGRVGEPIMLENGSITVTCSSGTAFYPHDGDTPEALLAKADLAMYQAKKSGRNTVKFFEHQNGGGI